MVSARSSEPKNEPLHINASFIQWDNWLPSEIDIANMNVQIDDNNNGIIKYVVQPWDTLWKIASTFGTTISNIKKINSISWPIKANQVLVISDDENWILYTMEEKTNVVVFANKYNLNIEDFMTLNYMQDETELLYPWQEIFINITKDKAYELGLLEKPEPEIIPKSTIAYRPVINKSGKTSKLVWSKVAIRNTTPNYNNNNEPTQKTTSTIISQWTYTNKIDNDFYPWYCTWYAAIITPQIFPYVDEKTQSRPFGWDASSWCAWAKKAWFKIWSAPAAGSLIVYKRWWRGAAWHVWKVINYYPDDGKMIIRDMNFVAKFVVTERWEDVDNSNIKCYIYPWK